MPPRKHTLAELCIDIGDGQAIVTNTENKDVIEFRDCLPISIHELEYVLAEAKSYILYRNRQVFQHLIDEFPEVAGKPLQAAVKQINQLIEEFPEYNAPKEDGWGWNKITNVETAKSSILTSYMKDGKFDGDQIPIDLDNLRKNADILDFGCGVGRNIKTLLDKRAEKDRTDITIYGYDFSNMIEMAKEYLGLEKFNKVIWIPHPLSNLQKLGQQFDAIAAYIVLQHIPEAELRQTLAVLSRVLRPDGYLIVHSRGYLDDGHKNIWNIIGEYFTPTMANTRYNPGDASENHQTVIFKPIQSGETGIGAGEKPGNKVPSNQQPPPSLLSESNIREYVAATYLNVLKRPADPGGLHNWTMQILTGQITKEDLPGKFRECEEYKKLGTAKSPVAGKSQEIAYTMMGTDRLHEIKDYVPKVLPYVDHFIYIDGGSTDGTVEFLNSLKSDKVEVYVHPWNDQFSGQRNNYLQKLRDRNYSGFFTHVDTDEHLPEETLKSLRSLVASTEGTSTHGFTFRCIDVFLDDNDRTKEVSRNLSNYYKPKLIKFNPKIHYEGEPHETIMDMGGNWVQSELTYIHFRTRRKVIENAVQNFFISNSNRRSEKWLEFRYYCAQQGLEKFKDFFKLFKEGKLSKEIEDWIWNHRQDNENAGDSEVREMAQLYYEIYHPEKKKV